MNMISRPFQPRTQTRLRGFTLIELLVVISIIMLLALIVAPMYAKFSKGAKVETARNMVSSVITQARSLAMKMGRETMAIGYWRGKGWRGSASPMENSMTMTIFAKDIGNGAWGSPTAIPAGRRSPTSTTITGGACLSGGFLPFQELALPTYDDFLFAPKDPNAAGGGVAQTDINAASPIFRLPAGMALAKPAQNPNGGQYYFEEFVLFRFRPDGTMSLEPPIDGSDKPATGNLGNWLNHQWRMAQPSSPGTGGNDQINGDASTAGISHITTDQEYQKRGFYMTLPTDNSHLAAKLPTNAFVVYDYQAMVESGVDPADLVASATWINQNGTLGVININTGQVTFTAENDRR